MTETATIPAEDSQSFGDYLLAENAKEQAESRGEAPVEPAPKTTAESVVSGAQSSGETVVEEPVEPAAEPSKPESDRNADGTFKAKSDKVTTKGEWKRNQELTARLRETERQLQEARTAVPRDTPAPVAQPLDPSDPEPTLEMFLEAPDPYAKLAREMALWAVREDRRQAQRHEASAAVLERVSTFIEAHPDYHEKLAQVSDVIFPNEVLQALADDDLGPAVAYHLADHPEEARRIAALSPLEGVKAIGKLLTRFETAPSGSVKEAPKVSQAQPLIKPVSAAPIVPAATDTDPETTPFSDYVNIENRKDRQRAREMRGV